MLTTITASDLNRDTHVACQEATPDDAVLGQMPLVVAYAQSDEEVARVLKWANDLALKVSPCAARTKLDRGAPPARCDILLDLGGLSGVVQHAAGDMTVTVKAGTRLDELQSHLRREGQFLAIDPPVPGTVGGLIATADSGPRRLRYGGVRDLILGVTFARTDGVIAKAGGKVVKNVAGYDLPKLMAGSLGTLAVIVEATFRLYPVPPASVTVAGECGVQEAGEIGSSVAAAGIVPTIVDYYSPGDGIPGTLALRCETSLCAARRQAEKALALFRAILRRLGILEGHEEAPLWLGFDKIAETSDGEVLARLTSTISDLPGLIESMQAAAKTADIELAVRAHLRHGQALLRCGDGPAEKVLALLKQARREAEAHGASLAVWRAPVEIRDHFDVWGDAGDGLSLMRRVKRPVRPEKHAEPGPLLGRNLRRSNRGRCQSKLQRQESSGGPERLPWKRPRT